MGSTTPLSSQRQAVASLFLALVSFVFVDVFFYNCLLLLWLREKEHRMQSRWGGKKHRIVRKTQKAATLSSLSLSPLDFFSLQNQGSRKILKGSN